MSGFKGAFGCCGVSSLEFSTRMIFTCVFLSESCLKLPFLFEIGMFGVGSILSPSWKR